jgi:hypothetical protein
METQTDKLNRRSRWSREGSKKAQLTARDVEIFRLLQRYRYLSADYIHAFIGGSKKRLVERLNLLQREPNFYLSRPGQQRQTYNANYRSLIYENDTGADRVLQNRGYFDPTESIAWLNRGRESHTTFPHSVMICEALASIELGLKGNMGLRFIPWQEIEKRMPEQARGSKHSHCLPVSITHIIAGKEHRSSKALMPDAVFGIEIAGKGARFFALECDRDHEPLVRSNMEQTSYLRKILQYQQVAKEKTYKAHWGLPNLLALNLTTNEFHQNKIMELARDLTGGKGASYLLFNTMPSLGDFARPEPPTGRLFAQAWRRAGHPDFHLAQI